MSTPRPVTPIGIVAQRLAELSKAVRQGRVDGADLVEQLDELGRLAGGVESYSAALTTPESTALAELVARTQRHDWAAADPHCLGLEQEMLSGHLEGQLLKMLVAVTRATRVLEVGMFTGYSALAMAEALPIDGELIACEIDPDVATFARRGFDATSAGARIQVRIGAAADTLDELWREEREFDLVFIDADKAGYIGYVDTVLSTGLLAEHGLLCVDNTLMQGDPWTDTATANGDAIAKFNDFLRSDPRVEQVVLPIRDGVTLARRVPPGGSA